MIDLEYRAGTIVIRTRTGPVLTSELLEGLSAALTYVGTVHPIVLTGAGGVFAPDLDPVPGPGRTRARAGLRRVLAELRAHPLPVVAAVNGDAVGAGYLLAEAADVRVMSGGFLQPSPRSGVSYCARTAVTVGLVEHRCPAAELIAASLRQIGRLSGDPVMAGRPG
ncbi:enoyl-CoA hydratase/isomerase family protein [Prauserella flavalba]|uniref:Enoyl-CoA hydratase/isomerase family protein n=1 Tax=Prauserella flavalba TaxID=1477506 RepID=A0A318LDE6_9PSEU|nr:enoyl-CoA hydratase/isomerase family protein [Prauserella flavalba]PXY18706.1 hypothetical protein BA062_34425 [Prauserella flavalba]